MILVSKLKQYVITHGDTLPSIAQRILSDTSLWMNIAVLNNLDYPFIVDTAVGYEGYNVKVSGDIILLPASVTDDDTKETLNSDSEDMSLGRDLLLDEGDFVIGIDGDIQTVSGVECLHQDLINALTVELGTLPYHPDHGSKMNLLVGNRSNRNWLDQANVELARTFKNDPRVVDVKDVAVILVDDQVSIFSTVVTKALDVNISKVL